MEVDPPAAANGESRPAADDVELSPLKKKRKSGRVAISAEEDDHADGDVVHVDAADVEMESSEPAAAGTSIVLDEESEEEAEFLGAEKPKSTTASSGRATSLRPKKDLSAADRKKIALATAEKKSQPGIASFFGGGGAKPAPKTKSITSFFKPAGAAAAASSSSAAAATPAAAPAAAASAPTASPKKTAAFVNESGKITSNDDATMTDVASTTTAATATPSTATPAASSASPVAASPKKQAAKLTASKRKRDEEEKPKNNTSDADAQQTRNDVEKTPAASTAAAATPKVEPAAAAKIEPAIEPAAKESTSSKPAAAAASSSASKPASKKKAKGKSVEDEEDEPTVIDADVAKAEADADEEDDWEETDAALLGDSASIDDDSFDPVRSATWKQGEDVPFAALAHVFERLEGERSRLLTVGWLSDFLRSVIALTPDQLVTVVYLCCNQIAPAYEGERTNVGDSILLKAIGESTGAQLAQLKQRLKADGDLGEVAMTSRGAQKTLFGMMTKAKPKLLKCRQVFDAFRELANTDAPGMSGAGSQARRANKIKELLVACQGSEAKYIVRGLQGNLRIHMAEKGVIAALARAFTLTPPSLTGTLPPPILDLRKEVKDKDAVAKALETNVALLNQAYIELPNHRKVIESVLAYGVAELPNKCFLEPGIPVKVMLGKPCNGPAAILEKFGDLRFTLEYKYDGARAQIHLLDDGSMKIYSRNSQDDTEKYPELIKALPQAFNTHVINTVAEIVKESSEEEVVVEEQKDGATEVAAAAASSSSAVAAVGTPFTMRNFIIDCEVVAWDRVEKKILPFQALTTRKKKNVSDEDITVQVCLFGFDLIYLNGVVRQQTDKCLTDHTQHTVDERIHTSVSHLTLHVSSSSVCVFSCFLLQSYMNDQFLRRRDILRSHFHVVPGLFMFATHKDTSEAARETCTHARLWYMVATASYLLFFSFPSPQCRSDRDRGVHAPGDSRQLRGSDGEGS